MVSKNRILCKIAQNRNCKVAIKTDIWIYISIKINRNRNLIKWSTEVQSYRTIGR